MWEILIWVVIGFLAQLVDGSLGMAWGVTSTTALMTVGISPTLASASVHTSEIFTTLVSGGSHFRLGNVQKKLVLGLLVPGIIGGIMGATVSVFTNSRVLQLVVSLILLGMGILVFSRFIKKKQHFRSELPDHKLTAPLGWTAAFLDALGGGGWGPVATTTLVTNRVKPNEAIGSVNFTEFFVTVAEAATFMVLIGWETFSWLIIAGLMIGGVACAPLAAWLCKRLPIRALGVLVGLLIIVTNVRTILKFGGLIT